MYLPTHLLSVAALCVASALSAPHGSYAGCEVTETIASFVTEVPMASTTTVTVSSTKTEYIEKSDALQTHIELVKRQEIEIVEIEARAPKTKTQVVPAPSGFIPFRSSLKCVTCDSNCGADPVIKRSIEDDENEHVQEYSGEGCTTRQVTVTSTIVAEKSVVTETTLQTLTTTINILATSTMTSTSFETYITTSTKYKRAAKAASTTTVYAACATDNIGDLFKKRATGYPMGITGDDQNNSFATVNTAYDCCVFAFTQTFEVGIWQFAQGTCVTYNVPSGGQADNTYKVLTVPADQQSIFGNGPNGEFIKGGKGIFG